MELSRNSKEMKTAVETFVIEETAGLIYDNEQLDRWNVLVNDLGLKGQTEIIKPTKSPIPFMFIKQGMKSVFETLCPSKVDVSEYNITPIPLEILDLVALSKRESYFQEIQIWYDDKNPDPLCVGTTCKYYGYKRGTWNTSDRTENMDTKQAVMDITYNNNVFQHDEKFYLLGKWADVKHSFEELKEMATKRYLEEQGNYHRSQIIDAQRNLDDLETKAFNLFN